jgi:drug/metabolite transporter (DMT)-like permease
MHSKNDRTSITMVEAKSAPRILWLVIFCYAVIYTVWGSTYYFIRISVISIPPLWVVGLRFLCGGGVMLGVCIALRQWTRLPTAKEWGTTIFIGLCLLVGGNMLVTIAEKFIDSYFAALVISCTPIAVALYNRAFFKIKLPVISGIGILSGVCGVGILLYN